MKSNCCQAEVWVQCGVFRFQPKLEYVLDKEDEVGKTCYYVCYQCHKPCDAVEK